MADEKNLKISGSGHVNGGKYDQVKVSGSAHIDGEVTCNGLHISGSAHMAGSVTAIECKISGSAHITGFLDAESVHISGSATVDRHLSARQGLKISGGAHVGGSLHAQEIHLSGGVKIGEGIECEQLIMSGSFRVGGLVNAGKMQLNLNGKSTAEELGGDEIIVLREMHRPARRVFGMEMPAPARPFDMLTVNAIEGGRIHLEGTQAKVVRGEVIEIGPKCEIDRIEYSVSLDVDPQAVVGERVKVERN